jgi:hypothetical protein
MRASLGKGWIWLWVFAWPLLASEYHWQINTSQATRYAHQPIAITYSCMFEGQGGLYTIELNPSMQTEAYRLEPLRESERIADGKRINEYRFLLFPKQPGTIHFAPTALMRKTTKASIENTVIGRDNVEDLVFTDTTITLPALTLDVLASNASISGVIQMSSQVTKTDVMAFEPLHVTLVIDGIGNLDQIPPFDINITDVTTFAEVPERDFVLTSEGYKGSITQRFALIAADDYTIPAMELTYFDVTAKQLRTLKTDAQLVHVLPLEALPEMPEAVSEGPWQWEWHYLYYLISIAVGFIAGRWFRWPRKERVEGPLTLYDEIEQARSMKMLLTLLTLHDPRLFSDITRQYEHAADSQLSRAKQEARFKLRSLK